MQDEALDHLDQRLIHALQISPRAPWSGLAPVLGADPVTLSRRWARLTREGLVYVTGYGWGDQTQLSLIEIECSPGETLAVAHALAADGEAFTIDLTAGGRDIMLSLGSTGTEAVASWTLERIRGVSGVRAMRTHLVSDVVTDARSWRMRALSKEEVARVAALDARPTGGAVAVRPHEARALSEALTEDARIGVAELAARVGMTPRRTRDALATMRASGRFVMRVDVARAHTPWPIYAWYFLRVPAAMVARVGPQLGRMDEVRLVVTTVGEYNVIVAVWLRTLQDVGRLEAVVEERLPGVTIADRSVVLRTTKHLGHLLDAGGRATAGIVPMP